MLGGDPLKIYYLLVLETDEAADITPFQGFSVSWAHLHWALHRLTGLPADVLERSQKLNDIITQRMGGARSLMWIPINIGALEQLSAEQIGIFMVCFSGEQGSALRTRGWIETLPHPVLHVSNVKIEGVIHIDEFSENHLRDYCCKAFDARYDSLSQLRREAAKSSLAKWKEPKFTPTGLYEHQHNISIPNHMSLIRAARSLEPGKPFVGLTEDEYSAVILDSAAAVVKVREEVGFRPLHRMTLIDPPLVLTEPALYRFYGKIKPEGPFAKTLRLLQKQDGLCTTIKTENAKQLVGSRKAQWLISIRRRELQTHTLGVGLHAAQTCSAVLRLSPGINRVFPSLSAFARSVRSEKRHGRLKARRLYSTIQNGLKQAVGTRRIGFIKEVGGPIKIVSDAPLEWLPIGNLPLSLRYLCSRINATPGNLMMGLLAPSPRLTFSPKDLQKILLLSAFSADDPLRMVLREALEVTKDGWEGKVDLVIKTAQSKSEFIDALNSFDGHILIFDGHGADNSNDPVGKLIIGNERTDVWELRGTVRVPPVVILSACDTHGIDAASHATVGNGFLALGARTVLATLLPVGGLSSAKFIARLVYRIADFLPAALRAEWRVLNWTEVIGGMIRMLLATEMLDQLVSFPTPKGTPRWEMQFAANGDINSGDESWFDNLIENIAAHRKERKEAIEQKANGVVACSEAIRYAQLGSPETILIDDGRIRASVMDEYNAAPRPSDQD
ncbi:MAG TPA: CHAT domain-containing protein [Xanthobacteraceae bacterium]|nr:CHAT domain-containing protein [Xanthobacteraceae bacterium]